MTDLTTWVPRLITGTAVVHVGYGLVAPSLAKPLRGIAKDGFVDTVGGDAERASSLWYMVTGITLLGLGELARWTGRETGRVPARLGGWLLAVAAPLIALSPASGGWLVGVVGATALRAARADGSRPAANGTRVRAAIRG